MVENLRERQAKLKSTGEENWIFFLDLKSAFDTVDHEILFEKMNKMNIQ